MSDKVLIPGEDDIVDYPIVVEVLGLDIADNADGIGIRGLTIEGMDGTQVPVRIGMSDWAAMQVFHFLQRYAAQKGLEPVRQPGPQPRPLAS